MCEEASVGRGGLSRRVRVIWRRRGVGTGGSLESPGPREREIYERSEKLRRNEVALEQTISCLGTTLDAFQSQHVKRIVSYAVRLGQAYGLDEQALKALRWGATLHDGSASPARFCPELGR